MKQRLEQAIQEALRELFDISGISFTVEFPGGLAHGDYATNVALVVAKQLEQKPLEIAEKIVGALSGRQIEGVDKVAVAGPGFINFTLTHEAITETLKQAIEKGSAWGASTIHTGKKILVEHSSPNLFKPFHIGHLMNNTIGEAITRLARVSGADVATMSFPSDISLGVAKAIFIILEKHIYKGHIFEPKIRVLGDAYTEGTKRYENDDSIHSRVKEIADNLYAGIDSEEYKVFQVCKKYNIEYFEHIVAQLGSHFDSYIYESEAGVEGKRIVQAHTPDVFTESEGAVVYIPKEETGLHTAVFLNSQGNPTYEAKDLGLLELKFTRHNPDLSIFITDAQQVSHFDVVLDASSHIDPSWAKRSLHRFHGRMSFKGQKMSSRLGGVPLVEDVLGTVVEEVKAKNSDVTQGVAQMIGIAALKFAILRAMAGKNINFDPDTSLSFEGDSGPYVQYTAVRARAVLAKAQTEGITSDATIPVTDTIDLERLIGRFPTIVERSIAEWAPHHIVGYLLEISQTFNSWYGNNKIIDTAHKSESAYRLFVTQALLQTVTNGLHILGIDVPERM